MSYQGVWQGDWRWSFLLRYDGQPLWDTTWLNQRLTDWPGSSSTECIDCVLDSNTGRAVLQYKSFPPFGSFASDPGNGGDVLGITDGGWIKVIATSDGGHPGQLYYFVGPGAGMPADGRPGGWVIAGPDLAQNWNSCISWIAQSFNDPWHPVGQLTPAYTQYTLQFIDVPYLVNGGSQGSSKRWVIVSEHYDHEDPMQATECERFGYAQYMGCFAWEFWATKINSADAAARAIPCPFFGPGSGTLNPVLRLSDARRWSNWTRGAVPNFTVKGAGWPVGLVIP